MKQYLDLGDRIFYEGNTRGDRTGTGTRSLFGRQMRFDLAKGFPLVTTKPVHLKSIIVELLWFLDGSTNNNLLKAQGVNIWNEWALKDRMELSLDQRRTLLVNTLTTLYPGAPEVPQFDSHEALDSWSEGFNRGLKEANDPSPPLEKMDMELIGDKDGYLGPVYGKQWRSWDSIRLVPLDEVRLWESRGFTCFDEFYNPASDTTLAVMKYKVDQIQYLIDGLKKSPFSRRHIVTGWNPTDMPVEGLSHEENVLADRQALPPCHTMFQFYVQERRVSEIADAVGDKAWKQMFEDMGWNNDGSPWLADVPAMYDYWKAKGVPILKLDCQLYQRSADWCLGVPFNIASYSLLTMMVAQCVGMVAGEFIHTFGDSHIYANHLETWEQVQRIRQPQELPRMKINPDVKDIFSFKYEDFTLEGYNPVLPAIKYKVAV